MKGHVMGPGLWFSKMQKLPGVWRYNVNRLNATEMVKMVTFMPCIFYHHLKNLTHFKIIKSYC